MLAKANAIMKRLRSTETLGSTSAINSDKTGTLTLNQMTAVEMTIPGRRYTISGGGYATEGTIKHVFGPPEVPLEQFLLPMALCADAVVKDGGLVGDPTEGALVVLAEKGGLDAVETRRAYPRVAELPFDSEYKMMATFHEMQDESGRDVVRCLVKGAPDQLLARAAFRPAPEDLSTVPVDDDFKKRYMDENERLAGQGLRVMATGRKDFDPDGFDPSADLLPLLDGMTVLALVGIVDPPRPAAKAAIAVAHEAGIRVRMITGDHVVTAGAIADELGIPGRAISGAEFKAMSDAELDAAIGEIGVIARVAPEDKVRLVESLKRNGDIVAMTGDGVNDAPALKAADIGIAMGITGTEVSKEAATMILTDDNFATIVKAVELGRGLYDNLTKYIRFQMGVLIGFIVTFLGASIFNVVGGVPFVPLQTLYVNFTTQVLQAIGLGYGRPAEGLMQRKPRASERGDAAAAAPDLGRDRRARDGRHHAGPHRLGRRRVRERDCADDGPDGVRHRQRPLLPHHARRAALGVLARHPRGSDVPDVHRRVARGDPVRDRARDLPPHPRHRPADLASVARVHRGRARHHPGVRGQAAPAPAPRAGGGQPTARPAPTRHRDGHGSAMTTGVARGPGSHERRRLLDALLPVVVLIGAARADDLAVRDQRHRRAAAGRAAAERRLRVPDGVQERLHRRRPSRTPRSAASRPR